MSTVINKIFNGRKKEGGLPEQDCENDRKKEEVLLEQEENENEEEFDPAICDAILNAPFMPPIVNYYIGIHQAAFMDLPEIINYFLQCSTIYLNSPNQSGWTPLMYAAQNGSAMACELLLYYGARIDIRNPKGQTAIDLAHYWGHRYLVWLLENTLYYQRRAMMNPYLRQLMLGPNSHSY